MPRAVVRDLHTGVEAARLMSLLMLVFSISPILAPLAGSLIIESFGWRAIFWAVTLAAAIGIVLMIGALDETRPPEQRGGRSFRGTIAGYRRLLRDRSFVGLSLIGDALHPLRRQQPRAANRRVRPRRAERVEEQVARDVHTARRRV